MEFHKQNFVTNSFYLFIEILIKIYIGWYYSNMPQLKSSPVQLS